MRDEEPCLVIAWWRNDWYYQAQSEAGALVLRYKGGTAVHCGYYCAKRCAAVVALCNMFAPPMLLGLGTCLSSTRSLCRIQHCVVSLNVSSGPHWVYVNDSHHIRCITDVITVPSQGMSDVIALLLWKLFLLLCLRQAFGLQDSVFEAVIRIWEAERLEGSRKCQ